MRFYRDRIKKRTLLHVAIVVVLALIIVGPVLASDPNSLSGSNFEIDEDANLKVDHPGDPDSIDWANVNDEPSRQQDEPTGKNDNSYAGGSKENNACPGTTTGSIPNNKSDLLTFGVYVEPDDPGFLHVFWSRVNEPNGTTLMDFEFNQSNEDCGNGVNRVRTVDDLLLEYRIEQGGAAAEITLRKWTGTEWGNAIELSAQNPVQAVGTINDSPIPFAESDGLITSGQLSPRTFGEASIDLDFIFEDDKCLSFGSAFLKSRASDSFTSQLKDYIDPVNINLTNCGKVIIRKETDPDENPNSTSFGFTKSFSTDPSTSNTFSLMDDGAQTFNNVLFDTNLTVSESTPPSGWVLQGVNCSASSGVSPSINGDTVTFDIDSAADVLDCTFTNQAKGTIIVEKIKNDNGATQAFGFTSNTLSPGTFSLTPTGTGAAGKDSKTFADLNVGTYDVAETAPAGWNLASATCDDSSDPSSIGLSAGETVTCTFTNERERGAILVTKTRKHAASGSGDHPHEGVTFTVNGVEKSTNANGQACFDNLLYGDYDVTETLPNGYTADGDLTKNVTVSVESTCGDGNEATVSFGNTPLTDITVSVDSQVDGGTASEIDCVLDSTTTGANGDGSLTLEDLEPGTYVCTIVVDP